MKRSQIEHAISYAKDFIAGQNVHLPMFASWDLETWRRMKPQLATVIKTMRGWDVTDFGSGDFDHMGAVLFTIRNGVPDTDIGCPYAEKLIFMREGQELPLHFHFSKTEDIINRNGGVLRIQVYNSLPDGEVDMEGDVRVLTDGLEQWVKAGDTVDILPGNSMTIYPGLYHRFLTKPGSGDLLVGEVSKINDDHTDNRFAIQRPRFSKIEEDAPLTVPLCNEYEQLL